MKQTENCCKCDKIITEITMDRLCDSLALIRKDMEYASYPSARGRVNDLLIMLGCEESTL